MLKPEDESGRRFRAEFRDWLEQNLDQDIRFLTFRPPPPIAIVSQVAGNRLDRTALAAYPPWHGGHADSAIDLYRGAAPPKLLSRRQRSAFSFTAPSDIRTNTTSDDFRGGRRRFRLQRATPWHAGERSPQKRPGCRQFHESQ